MDMHHDEIQKKAQDKTQERDECEKLKELVEDYSRRKPVRHTVLAADIIHLRAASPALRERWIDAEVRSMESEALSLYDEYIKSCARGLAYRNYNQLRKFLARMQWEYRDMLEHLTRYIVRRAGIDNQQITKVYNIGAGLSKTWNEILQRVFPSSTCITVDKDSTVHPQIWCGMEQLLDRLRDEEGEIGEDVLFFFSEVIHCKAHLYSIFVNDYAPYNVLVNELHPNIFINERLKASDGRMYSSYELVPTSRGFSVINYSTYFRYYLAARKALR